jgi:hypothetical protein
MKIEMEKIMEMEVEMEMKSKTSKTSKTSKPKTSNISNISNISNKTDESLSVRKKKVKLKQLPPRLKPLDYILPLPPRHIIPLHSLLPLPPHPIKPKPLPPHLLLKRPLSFSPTFKAGKISPYVRRVRPVLQPPNRPLKPVRKASPPPVKVRSNSQSSSIKKGHHLLR